jgi:alpha-D-xyloside xylohydrolase
MKFTAGFWEIRPGVTPTYPAQVHEVDIDSEGMTVYAATKTLNHRGDTLNLPLLTVRYSSPMPDVIRVQVSHHKGGLKRGPDFKTNSEPVQVAARDEAEFAELSSGDLSVRVEKKSWKVEFRAGERVLTNSGWRNLAMMDSPDGRFRLEQLALGVGECVYGLGERFTPFVKNGQVVEMWNEDGGTASEIAYKNIPFYLTNRGYGVFVNHPEMVSFEVGSEKVERVQFSVPGETLEYFIISGSTPEAILERYTALTGRPALPPAWSFGLWLTTSFTTSYDEQTVSGFIQGMADRDLPLHVFHFDCFWMKEFHWVNFEWDQRVFPDPRGMLGRLKERGLKICLWINPYIAERSALFDEGAASGFLIKRRDGSIFQWDRWQAGMALVDFTNPDARSWYAGKLSALVDMGVDCFKTDFGERIPTDVVYFDGSDPVRMHNYYTQLYNQTVFELLEAKLGKGQATVFARSATTGGQQYPVHWGGDSTASFESMAESLRGGLSLSLSGFGFWSHDMGGFEQTASPDVYKRWCAFGLLSSHSRLHGSTSYRVPWLFDEEAVDVLRYFTKLKCRLMPYLFAAAVTAHRSGTPMMRAMPLAFPADPGCDTLDRQYMLGPDLLVAPVMRTDGMVDYYLPAGRWTHFLSGEVMPGGCWVREMHDFLSLPLLARPNSVIAVGAVDDRPDYDFSAGVTFHLFEIEAGARIKTRVPSQDGQTDSVLRVEREGNTLTLAWDKGSLDWQAVLHGPERIRSVEGGAIQGSSQGGLILIPNGARMIVSL